MKRNRVNRDELVLKIRNDAIQRVNMVKYLGIMIVYNLSFDDHLKHIVTKIAKKSGIMARSTKLVNKNYKIKVYNITAFCLLLFNIMSFKCSTNGQTTDVVKEGNAYYFEQQI